MRLALYTPLEAFRPDIADVVRIFYGEGSVLPEDAPGRDGALVHTHELEGGVWRETFALTLEGQTRRQTLEAPAVFGGLEEKRQLKRLIKRCCYALLRDVTGRRPPWGSLTGIRPTRLYYQRLERGDTREQARSYLAEQFDLSPEKIGLLDEIVDAQRGLIDVEENACDLYIGIPFCTTRCAYCSFSSGEIGDGRLVEPYLTALLHEIDACARMAKEKSLRLRAGYVGGGTPTSLSASQLDRLLSHAERAFGPLAEWTVEGGRPDTLTRERLTALRDHPVTRISVNPQTMRDETLRRIGRAHTAAQTEEAFSLARAMGFDDINMDVIAALPGEDADIFGETLRRVSALAPESLTVHTLAIKRSSRLHEQGFCPDARDAARMVAMGREAAHAMGMRAYYLYRQKYMAENLENVGYALPGRACRYNIDNMEETTSVLALGAGGITKVVRRKEEKIVRAPNIANIEQYIARVDEMIERKRRALFPA